jgi:hypothetical protein
LTLGAVAGPLFVVTGLAQAFVRTGFDLREHTLSLLSNGNLGWIQIANFVVSGALFLVGAAGMRAAVRDRPGRRWGPLLVGVFGLGMLAAGVFVPDPAYGFPPGTADGKPASISWHGALHYTCATLAFLSLVGACVVFARRFCRLGEARWGIGSLLTGLLVAAGVAAVASGSHNAAANLTFIVTALLGFLWASALALKLRPTIHYAHGKEKRWDSQSFISK